MARKKKLLIVAPYGFIDRMSNYMEFLTGRLLAENHWQVTAIVQPESGRQSEENIAGIKIYRYPNILTGLYFAVKIFSANPDIVHVYNLRNNRFGIIMAMLAKALKKPLLFTEYGLLHDHYLTDNRDNPLANPIKTGNVIKTLSELMVRIKSSHGENLTENVKNYFFHWPLTHADLVVFVSKHNLPIAKNIGLKNTVYMPYLMDDRRWNSESGGEKDLAIAEKIKKIKNETNALFIGQLKLRKGWDILLEAIPLIPAEIIQNFIFITPSAENEETPEFSKMINSSQIKNRIVFSHQVSDRVLKMAYDASSVILVPSRYEGFGLVPIEAFENEKPVVASNVPAITDSVIDGYSGILIPPEDPKALAEAVIRVISDKKLCQKLVAGGQETLRKMRLDGYKNQWLEMYDSIIAGNGRFI